MMKSNRFGGGSRGGKFGGGRDSRGPATMHDAVCDGCGDDCQVPFKPNGKKPVFCNKCFKESGNDYSSERSGGREDYGPGARRTTMHNVICSSCGDDCQVPFQPTGDRPVYCNKCFGKSPAQSSGGSPASKGMGAGSKSEFDIINGKLDRILKMLGEGKPQEDSSFKPRKPFKSKFKKRDY